MGDAALLLLIGTMISLGGVADDPAVGLEEPVAVDTAGVAVDAQVHEPTSTMDVDATVQLDAEGPDVSVTTSAASVSVDARAVDERVFEHLDRLPIEIDRLPPTAGTVTVDLTPGPEDPGARAPGGHVAMTSTPEQPAPTPVLDGWAFQLGPAAAMAAVAAMHARPPMPGWRRLLPLAPWAGLFSRISREDVLEHETREAVYELLKRTPGCSLEEIADALELSRSTARHHVRVLVDAEMIAQETRGRCRIHYPVGRRQDAIRRHLLSHDTRARVAEELDGTPRSVTDLAEALDENPGAVHFHLKKLCEADLVERRENGRVTYQAARDALDDGVVFTPADA